MKPKEQKKIERPFLPFKEAAEYLGVRENTLYQYTHKKVIQFYKLRGRKLYFKREDLNDFILNKNNLVKSNDRIETEAITKIITGG